MATASEIQQGQRSRAKYATFAVFAVATYFLQWYHLAHHIPLMNLAAGVRDDWRGFAEFVSDAMVWLVPALLPLSTFLYTFSSRSDLHEHVAVESKALTVQNSLAVQVNVEQPKVSELMVVEKPEQKVEAKPTLPAPKKVLQNFQESGFVANCTSCGWSKSYDTELAMKRAISGHKPRCKGVTVEQQV